MALSAEKYPNMAAYIASLPHGLESYPQCRLRTNVYEDIVVDFPELAEREDLPLMLSAYLRKELRDQWVPEVLGNALLHLVRDVEFKSDRKFLVWARINADRLFAKPLYRIMMHVFSTSLVVMGATKRWAAFHEGSTLVTDPIRKLGDRFYTAGRLTYPPRLFNGLIISQFGAAYEAALEANRAMDPEVYAEEKGDTEAVYRVSWRD